jgi:hypothetical protein
MKHTQSKGLLRRIPSLFIALLLIPCMGCWWHLAPGGRIRPPEDLYRHELQPSDIPASIRDPIRSAYPNAEFASIEAYTSEAHTPIRLYTIYLVLPDETRVRISAEVQGNIRRFDRKSR